MRSSVLPLPLKGEKFGGIVVLEKSPRLLLLVAVVMVMIMMQMVRLMMMMMLIICSHDEDDDKHLHSSLAHLLEVVGPRPHLEGNQRERGESLHFIFYCQISLEETAHLIRLDVTHPDGVLHRGRHRGRHLGGGHLKRSFDQVFAF